MSTSENTVTRSVVVGSTVGLHARPAGLVAQAAAAQPATVTIATTGDPVDARSMLLLISLGAGFGDEVTVAASGEGAQESVDAIADLIATDLDADDE